MVQRRSQERAHGLVVEPVDATFAVALAAPPALGGSGERPRVPAQRGPGTCPAGQSEINPWRIQRRSLSGDYWKMLMNISCPADSAFAPLAVLTYVIIATYILLLTVSVGNAGLLKIYRIWQTARPIPWLAQASRGPDPASFGY